MARTMKGQGNSFLKSVENMEEILWGYQLRRNKGSGWREGGVFAIISFCVRPGSSGCPCLIDTTMVLLPWEVHAAPQAVLMGLPLPSPRLADPNTVFSRD